MDDRAHGPRPSLHVPRLRAHETALLVIDLQEKLVPTIADGERVVHNAALLLEMAAALGLPAFVTEHCPDALGTTVAPIRAAAPAPFAPIAKRRFGAAVPPVREGLAAVGGRTVLLCGIEAHVCVLQTALDLREAGLETFLSLDAIGASQPDQIRPAVDRARSAGAVPTGVMSAMYELLVDADHPARRACVAIAKRIRGAGGASNGGGHVPSARS